MGVQEPRSPLQMASYCKQEVLPAKGVITPKDVSHPEPSMPSTRTALRYVVATAVTSAVAIIIMDAIAEGSNYKYNQNKCTCDCFDRHFKGEHFDAKHQYRHVYFNMTTNTALVFIWSSLHLALLLAFVDRALACLYVTLGFSSDEGPGRLRWNILGFASVNFYGLVYGWWVVFNYINDAKHWSDMGVLWPTQLFFSFTDFVPAYVSYWLLSNRAFPSNTILRCSLSISVTHILLALWDQGAVHIFTRHHLASRDMMFLISDIAGVLSVAPYTDLQSGDGFKHIGYGVGMLSTFYLALKTAVGSR